MAGYFLIATMALRQPNGHHASSTQSAPQSHMKT